MESPLDSPEWSSGPSPNSPPSLLDVDDDNAQSPHQSQSLDPQKPEQHPEEDHNHRFHSPVPKQHLAEAQPPQTLVDHPKQSPHPLTVIQLGPLEPVFTGGSMGGPVHTSLETKPDVERGRRGSETKTMEIRNQPSESSPVFTLPVGPDLQDFTKAQSREDHITLLQAFL